MANYASNRLIITGPADELTRFIDNHVHEVNERRVVGPTLDLESIIPMPPEFTAGELSRDAIRKATGYDYPDEWAMKMWGTSRNPCEFNAKLFGSTLYDCRFDSAWGSPCGIIKEVARRFPGLRGTLASSEGGMDWCVIRDFADGESWYVSTDFDRRVARMIGAGWEDGPRRKVTAQATLGSLEALRPPHGPTYSRRPFDRVAAAKALELRLGCFYREMAHLGASKYLNWLQGKRS